MDAIRRQVVFIETICNDQKIVRRNIHAVGHTSPEYEEKAEDEAEQDFKARIESYKKVYQVHKPVDFLLDSLSSCHVDRFALCAHNIIRLCSHLCCCCCCC